jgi:hypothetical protein
MDLPVMSELVFDVRREELRGYAADYDSEICRLWPTPGKSCAATSKPQSNVILTTA